MKVLLPLAFLFCLIKLQAQQSIIFKQLEDSLKSRMARSDFKGASQFLDKMDALLANHGNHDSLRMRLLDNHAFYRFRSGEYEESVQQLAQAAAIAELHEYWDAYLDMQNNLGMIYSKLGNNPKAMEAYQEVLKASDSLGLPIDTDYVSTLVNYGNSLQSQGRLQRADSILARGLVLAKEIKDSALIAATMKFMAKNALEKNQPDLAIALVDTIQNHYFGVIAPRIKDDPIYLRAAAHFKKKNFQDAESDIVLAIELMKDHLNDPSLVDKLILHSKIEEAQGNFEEALILERRALRLKDSFDVIEMNAKVLDIEEKYKNEKKERENLELRQETAEKDLTIAEKNNVILLGSIAFLLIIGGLVYYQLRRFKRKNELLEQSILKREQMAKELAMVRNNIASDFHDDMGNRLARIGMLSKRIADTVKDRDREEVVNALNYIYNDADMLYKGTKDFMFSLKSSSDLLEEVVTYLSDFGQEYLQSFHIDFFAEKDFPQNLELPYYWNRQLILIFKEAMTNVAKHSDAQKAVLSTTYLNGQFTMCLSDNGKGFKESSDRMNCNGLENMKKRAKKLKSTLKVQSTNHGTSVCFTAKISLKHSQPIKNIDSF